MSKYMQDPKNRENIRVKTKERMQAPEARYQLSNYHLSMMEKDEDYSDAYREKQRATAVMKVTELRAKRIGIFAPKKGPAPKDLAPDAPIVECIYCGNKLEADLIQEPGLSPEEFVWACKQLTDCEWRISRQNR